MPTELIPGRSLGEIVIGDKIGSVLEVVKQRNRDNQSQLELRQQQLCLMVFECVFSDSPGCPRPGSSEMRHCRLISAPFSPTTAWRRTHCFQAALPPSRSWLTVVVMGCRGSFFFILLHNGSMASRLSTQRNSS